MTKRRKKKTLDIVSDEHHHDFCLVTHYCKTCGQHRELVLYLGQPCIDPADAGTVVAISHRRALEVHEERWAHVLSELDDDDLALDESTLEMIARDRHSEAMEDLEKRMRLERLRVCAAEIDD